MMISTDASTGTPTRTKLLAASEGVEGPRPTTLPSTRNTSTGKAIVPNAPSGSRRKILISIQVSFPSPRSIFIQPYQRIPSFPYRTPRQLQKHVLEVRQNRPEIRHADEILDETANHLGHQVTLSANRETLVRARDRLNPGDRAETLFRAGIVCSQHHSSLRAVAGNEPLRRVDINDPSVLDDG